MTTEAFVLIETEAGKVRDVAGHLRSLTGVEQAVPVTGPYDVIAVLRVPDLSSVGDLLSGKIHGIDGILRTTSCLSLDHD